jgi:RNA polymerase sigma factor (sigma-70 family)
MTDNLRQLPARHDLGRTDAPLVPMIGRDVPEVYATATLLLTDIEGSSALWEREPRAMARAVAHHESVITQVVEEHNGRVLKTRGEGDSAFAIFHAARQAVDAAAALQDVLADQPWATTEPIRVRIAVSTGDVEHRDGDVFGLAIARAARIRALARGGDIVLSASTAALVADDVPDGTELVELGLRELRGMRRPEHVYGLRMSATVGSPAVTSEEAARLVREAQAGSSDAFAQLVGGYERLVLAIAFNYRLGPADAEDVRQTVFFRLAQHLDRLRDPASVGSWIGSVARNECLSLIRRPPAAPRSDLIEDVEATASPEEELLAEEYATELWHAFARLSPDCQALLTLVVLSEPRPSYDEVASACGLPAGSIGPTRRRCLDKLKQMVVQI